MNKPELSLTTPAEMLAALPHLIGFVPTNDLVALMLTPAGRDATTVKLGTALRCPITIDHRAAQQFPRHWGLDSHLFPGAILMAVCEPGRDEHARRILHTVRGALQHNGTVVYRTLITHSVTEPGYWVDPVSSHGGATIAYVDSAATALSVTQGQVIAESRGEVEREFTTTEPAPPMAAEAQDIVALSDTTKSDLHQAITRNRPPTTDLAMRAALVVTAHVGLRDALLGLAVGHELVAGRLWTQIAAMHRGRTRAELLTMAAVAYYCGGDSLRARIALAHAAAAAEDGDTALPRLATMLNSAIRAGLPPSKIRDVIDNHRAASQQMRHP